MIKRIKNLINKTSSQPSYKVSKEKKDPRRFMNDLGAKLLCLFAAICLWFYVIGTESPNFEKNFTVPINLENASNIGNNLSVLSGYGAYAEITLAGKRSDINKISSSDLHAYVDLSDIDSSGTYTLDVYARPVANASVVVDSPSSLVVYVDKTITKAIADISVDYTGMIKSETLFVDEFIPSVSEILVEGPTQFINDIEGAKVELELDEIKKSVKIRQKVTLVDADGNVVSSPYIKITPSEIDVEVVVAMEKELPVIPKFKHGYFDSEHIDYNVLPQTVTLKGDPEIISSIDYVSTEPIDETLVQGSLYIKQALIVPNGTSALNSKCDIYLSIPEYTEKEIVIPNSYIRMKGMKDDISANVTSQLAITVCGPKDVVSKMSASDIAVEIQLNGDERQGDTGEYLAVISTKTKNVFLKDHIDRVIRVSIGSAGANNG